MTLTKILIPIYLCTLCNFGQLIPRKLLKFIATICHILRLKCTKFNFGWGSAPDPSTPTDPLAGFGVLLLRGWEGKEGERWGRKRRGGEGREGEGGIGEGKERRGREGRRGRERRVEGRGQGRGGEYARKKFWLRPCAPNFIYLPAPLHVNAMSRSP